MTLLIRNIKLSQNTHFTFFHTSKDTLMLFSSKLWIKFGGSIAQISYNAAQSILFFLLGLESIIAKKYWIVEYKIVLKNVISCDGYSHG